MEVALKPRGSKLVSTSDFIRSRLGKVGRDYCYHMWKEYSAHLIITVGERPPRYDSFARYWWILKQLGLIEPVGKLVKGERGWPRQFYQLVAGMEKSMMWDNPQFALYGEKVRFGARRYRRRVLGLPPRRPGRPRKIRVPPPVEVPPVRIELGRIWATAEKFLREEGYTISREDFESIRRDWDYEVAEYETFRDQVAYVVREAVEIEEVSWRKGELFDPREAPAVIREKARPRVEEMEKRYRRRAPIRVR